MNVPLLWAGSTAYQSGDGFGIDPLASLIKRSLGLYSEFLPGTSETPVPSSCYENLHLATEVQSSPSGVVTAEPAGRTTWAALGTLAPFPLQSGPLAKSTYCLES